MSEREMARFKKTAAIFLISSLSALIGCAAQKQADEYGSDAVTAVFACPGENWTSEQFEETFCLMTSVKEPFNYVLAEDTAEAYGHSVLVGATLGIALLFDGDIQEKWLAAAKEFAVERYGDGARVINFREHDLQYKAYAFEVIPPSGYTPASD